MDELIAPLTEETFVLRLQLLSARARDIVALREAMKRQVVETTTHSTND